MKIIPEIDLSGDCEIPYSPDIYDWVNENLPGMRRLTIGYFRKRNCYDNVATLEFYSKDEKNSTSEKPKHEGKEIKSDEICEMLMKIVQFDVEAKDSHGQYRFQISKNTIKGLKTVSKHFEPPTGDEDEGRFIPNPAQTEQLDVIPTLLNYINRLQDVTLENAKLMTDIVQPLQAQNMDLQKRIIELSNLHYGVKQLEFQKDMWQKDKELENELAIEKAKLDKQKKDTMWKTLKETGALKQFSAIAGRIADAKFGITVPNQPIEKESEKEPEVNFEEELRKNPLKACCNGLYGTLSDEQKDELKKELGEDYLEFENLLISNSEKEATLKLKNLMNKFSSDPIKLMKAAELLEEGSQRHIAMQIIQFGMNL